MQTYHVSSSRAAVIRCGHTTLIGELSVPLQARGVVVIAHAGSSGLSLRNVAVAESFVRQGFATLLLDLLTRDEELWNRRLLARDTDSSDHADERRSGIAWLANRVVATIDWVGQQRELAWLPVGLFAASTGAAAALVAATRRHDIAAIVSRGGRVDLADRLAEVTSPTLLIVGDSDANTIVLNHRAMKRMTTRTAIHVVPDSGRLLDQIGAFREVTTVSAMWFRKHFESARSREPHRELFD
jgi:putative phosphoribosyl transferase